MTAVPLLIWFMLAATVFAGEPGRMGEGQPKVEQNTQLVMRLFDEVFGNRDVSVIDELYAVDVVDHSAFPDQAPGVEGIRSAISGFFEAFGKLEITVEDVIADGDKVVTRETWTVTDKASEKSASGTIIHIFRVVDHRITDEWSQGWGWLEQL